MRGGVPGVHAPVLRGGRVARTVQKGFLGGGGGVAHCAEGGDSRQGCEAGSEWLGAGRAVRRCAPAEPTSFAERARRRQKLASPTTPPLTSL